MSNSTFSGNSATVGGGICNYGTLTVSNSTFAGNSANYGGGIATIRGTTDREQQHLLRQYRLSRRRHLQRGTLTVSNSTFNGNSAGQRRRHL